MIDGDPVRLTGASSSSQSSEVHSKLDSGFVSDAKRVGQSVRVLLTRSTSRITQRFPEEQSAGQRFDRDELIRMRCFQRFFEPLEKRSRDRSFVGTSHGRPPEVHRLRL